MACALVVGSARERTMLRDWAARVGMEVMIPGEPQREAKYHALLVMPEYDSQPPSVLVPLEEHMRLSRLWLEMVSVDRLRAGASMRMLSGYDELIGRYS